MKIHVYSTPSNKWMWEAIHDGDFMGRSNLAGFDSKDDCITSFGVFVNLLSLSEFSIVER